MKYFKQKIGVLIFVLFSSVFSACTDKFLDTDPEFQITANNFFNAEQDYDSALNAAYDPLQWLYDVWLLGDIASDNSLSGGESAVDVIGFQEIDDMTHHPENENLNNIFKNLYTGIFRCNYIMQNKDNVAFGNKNNLLAQTLFLRAFYYFQLIKFFGSVPLVVDRVLDFGQQFEIDKTPKQEIYAQIETDLSFVINNISTGTVETGRITIGAALALYGKVLLYQDKFSDAWTQFNRVIQSGAYQLESDFSTIFLDIGENNDESVFEIQHSAGSEWFDWNFYQGSEGNFAIIHNGIRGWSGDTVFANGWSFNVPVKALYDAYSSNDNRRDATLLDIVAYSQSIGVEDAFSQGHKHTGYYNLKYLPRQGFTSGQPEMNYSNNHRVIRYSDVLLMAAEALNRGGINDGQALILLNQVRARAGLDALSSLSGATLTQAIWDERRLELAMEGHRFFDLVRTGMAADNINNFVTGKHELFPIPQIQIDLTGNRWQQNPGY